MKSKNLYLHGFTLVELSIVIIIIGFLIAGISAGTSLVKSSKLNAIITETQNFRVAINTFKLKYNYFPGDLPHASSYWPSCDAAPTKCNGNGDGFVDYSVFNITDNSESYRAWQHLSLSGFIAGNYTGVATVAGQADIGINVPASKYGSGGYTFYYFGGKLNTFSFGKFAATSWAQISVLTPLEAYQIDKKIDDGLARTGSMWAMGNPGATNCYNLVGSQYTYNVSLTTTACGIHFIFPGPINS